jgi:hypothetical protein
MIGYCVVLLHTPYPWQTSGGRAITSLAILKLCSTSILPIHSQWREQQIHPSTHMMNFVQSLSGSLSKYVQFSKERYLVL